jgi:hypothetical protein
VGALGAVTVGWRAPATQRLVFAFTALDDGFALARLRGRGDDRAAKPAVERGPATPRDSSPVSGAGITAAHCNAAAASPPLIALPPPPPMLSAPHGTPSTPNAPQGTPGTPPSSSTPSTPCTPSGVPSHLPAATAAAVELLLEMADRTRCDAVALAAATVLRLPGPIERVHQGGRDSSWLCLGRNSDPTDPTKRPQLS